MIATSSGRLRLSKRTSCWRACSRRSTAKKRSRRGWKQRRGDDSKNVPLQYVLADRYRETGENDKAEALYKSLLSSQPTPQTYRALANSLLKRKKAADFLKVMSEAIKRPESLDAIKSQLAAAAADDEMAEGMLEAGLKQITADAQVVVEIDLRRAVADCQQSGPELSEQDPAVGKAAGHRAILRRAEPRTHRPERDRSTR